MRKLTRFCEFVGWRLPYPGRVRRYGFGFQPPRARVLASAAATESLPRRRWLPRCECSHSAHPVRRSSSLAACSAGSFAGPRATGELSMKNFKLLPLRVLRRFSERGFCRTQNLSFFDVDFYRKYNFPSHSAQSSCLWSSLPWVINVQLSSDMI